MPRMQINAPCVVTLTWKLDDAQNRPIDELTQPVEFFFGLEWSPQIALRADQQGSSGRFGAVPLFTGTLLISAIALLVAVPGGATPDMPADVIYIVTDVFPSHVVLDGNHPLAGMALRLTLKVRAVREASSEELEACSVGGSPIMVLGSGPAPGRFSALH